MEKKRGQHYVWRHYLTSWTNESGQLYCLRDNGIFPANPINVGKARDFYRLKNLSDEEISFVEKLIDMANMPDEIKQINKKFLGDLTGVFKIKKRFESLGRLNYETESKLDIISNNFVEDFHDKLESASQSYLDHLKNGNLEFLSDADDKSNFMFFLCIQYFRTNMIKNNVLKTFASGSRPVSPTSIENLWSVLQIILPMNLAFTLNSDDTFRIQMLKNISSIPFITGDQPVINTHADYYASKVPEELGLYYPVSPSLAVIITNGDDYTSMSEIQDEEVSKFNNLIFKASHEQIYANDETVLQSYII